MRIMSISGGSGAMEYMQKQSKIGKSHEVAAALLTDGAVVVWPENNSGERNCGINVIKINGKVYVEVGGVKREVAHIIHTHPGDVNISISNPNPLGVSDEDIDMGRFTGADMYYIMGNQMYSVDVNSEQNIKYPTLITP